MLDDTQVIDRKEVEAVVAQGYRRCLNYPCGESCSYSYCSEDCKFHHRMSTREWLEREKKLMEASR